jgi:spore germination protein GerM
LSKRSEEATQLHPQAMTLSTEKVMTMQTKTNMQTSKVDSGDNTNDDGSQGTAAYCYGRQTPQDTAIKHVIARADESSAHSVQQAVG